MSLGNTLGDWVPSRRNPCSVERPDYAARELAAIRGKVDDALKSVAPGLQLRKDIAVAIAAMRSLPDVFQRVERWTYGQRVSHATARLGVNNNAAEVFKSALRAVCCIDRQDAAAACVRQRFLETIQETLRKAQHNLPEQQHLARLANRISARAHPVRWAER